MALGPVRTGKAASVKMDTPEAIAAAKEKLEKQQAKIAKSQERLRKQQEAVDKLNAKLGVTTAAAAPATDASTQA
jgi:hypothetical protein